MQRKHRSPSKAAGDYELTEEDGEVSELTCSTREWQGSGRTWGSYQNIDLREVIYI